MKDQHTKIKGYRDLSQEEIDLMNMIKDQGQQLKETIEELYDKATADGDDTAFRWVAIAEMNLQQGIMAAIRSVARPESF